MSAVEVYAVEVITNRSELMSSINIEQAFDSVAEQLKGEPHLLPQGKQGLLDQFNQGLSALAFYNGRCIGHTTLWHLEEVGVFELGTTWVCRQYRDHHVAEQMYQVFLRKHQEKLILATTTNPAALALGVQAGLVPVARKSLPTEMWRASCVCPSEKTGVDDNRDCKMAWQESQSDSGCAACVFRVTPETQRRLGLQAITLPSR